MHTTLNHTTVVWFVLYRGQTTLMHFVLNCRDNGLLWNKLNTLFSFPGAGATVNFPQKIFNKWAKTSFYKKDHNNNTWSQEIKEYNIKLVFLIPQKASGGKKRSFQFIISNQTKTYFYLSYYHYKKLLIPWIYQW